MVLAARVIYKEPTQPSEIEDFFFHFNLKCLQLTIKLYLLFKNRILSKGLEFILCRESAKSSCTLEIPSGTSIGVGKGLKLEMTHTKRLSASLPPLLLLSSLSNLAAKKVGKLEAFSSA